MAELILTDEEAAAATYLEWDDEALGKLVRYASKMMMDEYGKNGVWIAMAAHVLIDGARDANADTSTIELKGATRSGEPIGDWQVEVKRLSAPDKGADHV